MINKELEIINKLGLHARAANKLVTTAMRFECDLMLEKEGRKVDAKSIMSIMMLAASCGTTVVIHADGRDEESAMTALVDLINDKFGEGE